MGQKERYVKAYRDAMAEFVKKRSQYVESGKAAAWERDAPNRPQKPKNAFNAFFLFFQKFRLTEQSVKRKSLPEQANWEGRCGGACQRIRRNPTWKKVNAKRRSIIERWRFTGRLEKKQRGRRRSASWN